MITEYNQAFITKSNYVINYWVLPVKSIFVWNEKRVIPRQSAAVIPIAIKTQVTSWKRQIIATITERDRVKIVIAIIFPGDLFLTRSQQAIAK